MKIYHLSHTDLDGYGAQVITNFYFNNVKFSNSNYGREIDEKFNQIVSDLDDEKSIVLITDLNLTMAQCADFSQKLEGKNAKIFLLDHHQSGAECASAFEWYFLDSSRCATKITHDFFAAMFKENEELKKFSDIVNAVDIWLKDDKNFEMGKVCLGLVANAKEINKIMFERENTLYQFHLLKHAAEFFNEKNDYIGLDMQIHAIKKEFFKFNKDDTLSNLISNYVVNLLSENKEKFSINYNEFRGILTYNIGNTSVIGNDFLVANPEFDFFIDITNKKTMSFRANGKVDVSAMAKHLVGGGGHVNASGGMFANFKDGFSYEAIKTQVVELINKKTQETL
ncbi:MULTISPECIES: DHH family phosphoesterase [Campylobacter]|uniref:DHH family phosphoesterase n=1 Tax=Campylobacter TaxID=194 RepID=UPI0014767556|nr:3'-to-5' oligoribonuclease B [Campylobacter sp. RM12916]MBE3022330.1 3'-to-5' oligoribonuclease B [Campylobacter sp. 7477a]MBE3609958.1 3'-to-5' oligoribonuclease B [Campylobacter sp. RM12916]